jgi:hypothetical protein
MKKCYFPKVAVENFKNMAVEKLQMEISRSEESISQKTARNHKEELLILGNQKRVAVLKVILEFRGHLELINKIEEIAVLTD